MLLCNFFSVHGKVKPKPLSFQEFDNTTSDAWGEDDDDVIKVDPEEKRNKASQPRVRTISGGDVRASIPTNAGTEPKKLPEQLMKKEEHKTSRPSPLSLLSKEHIIIETLVVIPPNAVLFCTVYDCGKSKQNLARAIG